MGVGIPLTIVSCVGVQEKVAKAQEVKDLAMASLALAVENEKKEQWRVDGRQMLFAAKKVRWVEKMVLRQSPSPFFFFSAILSSL